MMNIGVVPPPPGYLEALAGLLHTHGALLTFDEVKTGLTIAPGGATERFGVVPDIVCLAKALGGGVPCGADRRHGRGDGGHRRRHLRAGRHVQRQPADDGRGQGGAARGPDPCRLPPPRRPARAVRRADPPHARAPPPPRLRQRLRRQGRGRVLAGPHPQLPRLLPATTPATAMPTGCTSTTAGCSCRRGGRWSSGRCRSSTAPTTSTGPPPTSSASPAISHRDAGRRRRRYADAADIVRTGAAVPEHGVGAGAARVALDDERVVTALRQLLRRRGRRTRTGRRRAGVPDGVSSR